MNTFRNAHSWCMRHKAERPYIRILVALNWEECFGKGCKVSDEHLHCEDTQCSYYYVEDDVEIKEYGAVYPYLT